MLGYTTYFILKLLLGSRRAADCRLRARHAKKTRITRGLVGWSMMAGIVLPIMGDAFFNTASVHVVEIAQASISEPVAETVLIESVVDWTPERIEQEIRKTFPEDPETAVKIAKCESGLRTNIQSQHRLSYGQEKSFGVFQIHAPDWEKVALRLGYDNYKTNPEDNIAMARYIYDSAGKTWRDWSCYTKKMI